MDIVIPYEPRPLQEKIHNEDWRISHQLIARERQSLTTI